MTSNQRSIVLAVVVILGVLAVILYLARPSPQPATPKAAETTRPGPEASPSPPLPLDAARRVAFARGMAKRLAVKGSRGRPEAAGPDATIFRMTWPAKAPDPAHLEEVKQAEPLHRHLRSLGFKSIVLRDGERVVWSQSF